MAASAPFAGPLAAAWRGPGPARLRELLADPDMALPVPSADDRSSWAAADPATVDAVLRRATVDLTTPWPQPLAHAAARFHTDGDREEYEAQVFARQQRLSRAAVAAAVTRDPAWLDQVADGVVLLCEQSSWCWPAHDHTREHHGAVLPTVTDPCLDLGAGEVVGQLAWVDHLLAAALDEHYPGLRGRIRHEAWLRTLAPFLERRDWHWLGLDGDVHNWNPWIHGNLLVAALRLVDDRDLRAEVVDLVVQGLDRYVAVLPADGAIDEGYSYWWNGACRALEALDLLRHATGGALDASAVPALRATVGFPHRMHLGGPWYLNLADGPARPPEDQPWHSLHRAALATGDDEACRHAAAHRRPGTPLADEGAGLGRLLRALTDRAWTDAGPASPPLPRDVWLPSVQVLLARGEPGSSAGLTLAAKGGHNGEHHNHNDVGSVVVALDGVPVVVDAGRPTYTARTFGPDRYGIWTMTSGWHCVPQIRGTEQSAGAEYAAGDARATAAAERSELVLDLAGAYPRSDVDHWRRSAALDRTTGTVTITDAWELRDLPRGAPDGPTLSRFLLAGEVTCSSGRAEVRALAGAGTVVLTWQPPAPATLETRALGDPMLSEIWGPSLTRLSIDLAGAPTGTLTVTATVTP